MPHGEIDERYAYHERRIVRRRATSARVGDGLRRRRGIRLHWGQLRERRILPRIEGGGGKGRNAVRLGDGPCVIHAGCKQTAERRNGRPPCESRALRVVDSHRERSEPAEIEDAVADGRAPVITARDCAAE